MDFSTLFRTKENLNLDKSTLTILRYIAIIGQFIAINIVYFYLSLPFPIELSYFIIFIGLLTNIYLQFGIKINFAHRTFKWKNEAKGNAAVYCVIIGFANFEQKEKSIF